jgi:hypothetical protein
VRQIEEVDPTPPGVTGEIILPAGMFPLHLGDLNVESSSLVVRGAGRNAPLSSRTTASGQVEGATGYSRSLWTSPRSHDKTGSLSRKLGALGPVSQGGPSERLTSVGPSDQERIGVGTVERLLRKPLARKGVPRRYWFKTERGFGDDQAVLFFLLPRRNNDAVHSWPEEMGVFGALARRTAQIEPNTRGGASGDGKHHAPAKHR